jgi:hypothetical protein
MVVPIWRHPVLALILVIGIVIQAPIASAQEKAPQVVVAVADVGVNPYHRAFLRPENTEHPCTWVAGFDDCSIEALPLSVGMDDYYAAVEKDADVWASVVPGRWYWIPRTNIIGAVCDPAAGEPPAEVPDVTVYPRLPKANTSCIRDDNGGSGTASSVIAEAPDALLLIHDGDGSAAKLASAPVKPDVQVHRWAPVAPVPTAAAAAAGNRVCPKAFRTPGTVYFVPAGDGAPVPAVAGCERTGADVNVVGGAFPGYWKYNSWSAYDFASWHCRPVVVDGKTSATDDADCGTRLAAATAAGGAAEALRLIRDPDGQPTPGRAGYVSANVTTGQFTQALRNGASYNPVARYPVRTIEAGCTAVMCQVGWAPLPAEVASARALWGYGWLDGTVAPAIATCALDAKCTQQPLGAAEYNQARTQVRAAGSAP